VATTLNNIGNSYARASPAKALEYYEQALALREAALGKEHPDVAASCNNCANILVRVGRHEDAVRYYERALVIRRKSLGEGHASVAATINNLAGAWLRVKQPERARAMYEQAIACRIRALGPVHPDVGASYSNMGACLTEMKAFGPANEALAKAHAIQLAQPDGARSSAMVGVLERMATLHVDMGLRDDALRFAKEAMAIRVSRNETRGGASNALRELIAKLTPEPSGAAPVEASAVGAASPAAAPAASPEAKPVPSGKSKPPKAKARRWLSRGKGAKAEDASAPKPA
jgi:tetratricopeptide (TPR) repeat protein